ncbi:MAG: amino acid-binding protein [Desulfobacterales bacterium]|nr:amino acid-binding protein [Desulfobacterales bacterium]
MKLQQVSVPIENSRGRLYDITHALGEAGINLRALNLVDSGDFGTLRILVSDIVLARQVLMREQMPARVDDVVAVQVEDRPGSLANLLKLFMDNNIKVQYSYAFAGMSSGKAVMVFRFNDNDNAIAVLKANNANLLDQSAFGMLDTQP